MHLVVYYLMSCILFHTFNVIYTLTWLTFGFNNVPIILFWGLHTNVLESEFTSLSLYLEISVTKSHQLILPRFFVQSLHTYTCDPSWLVNRPCASSSVTLMSSFFIGSEVRPRRMYSMPRPPSNLKLIKTSNVVSFILKNVLLPVCCHVKVSLAGVVGDSLSVSADHGVLVTDRGVAPSG